MQARNLMRALAAATLTLAALSGCGGGGGDDAGAPQTFASLYAGSLASLNTVGGLTSPLLGVVFDDRFLDAGYTRAQLQANLQGDVTALQASPGMDLFPMLALSDVKIGDCDANNVCTLSGTLTNNDADATAIPFTTPVSIVNGQYRLLGDQKTS